MLSPSFTARAGAALTSELVQEIEVEPGETDRESRESIFPAPVFF